MHTLLVIYNYLMIFFFPGAWAGTVSVLFFLLGEEKEKKWEKQVRRFLSLSKKQKNLTAPLLIATLLLSLLAGSMIPLLGPVEVIYKAGLETTAWLVGVLLIIMFIPISSKIKIIKRLAVLTISYSWAYFYWNAFLLNSQVVDPIFFPLHYWSRALAGLSVLYITHYFYSSFQSQKKSH